MVANGYDGLSRRVKKHIDTQSPSDLCRRVEMRTEQPAWALSVLAVCLLAAPAAGRSMIFRPRPAILLRKSDRFIAMKAWNSVGLYGLKDGKLLREFPTDVYPYEPGYEPGGVDPQEQFLVTWTIPGTISLWEIDSGKKLWSKRPFPEEKCLFACIMSFRADGGRLLIVGPTKSVVYEARSGSLIREIKPEYESEWQGALSPNGSQVMLSDPWKQRSYLIDVSTGEMKRLNVGGGGRVRYSTDGEFVAFSSAITRRRMNPLRSESSEPASLIRYGQTVRVLSTHDHRKVREVGVFEYIKHIRPLPGGGFLFFGRGIPQNDREAFAERYARPIRWGTGWRDLMAPLGLKYDPSTANVEVIENIGVGMEDFDEERMVGVTTDYNLVTHVVDLKAWKSLLIIDNSRNASPPWYVDLSWGSVLGWAVAAAACLGGWAIIRKRRARAFEKHGNRSTDR